MPFTKEKINEINKTRLSKVAPFLAENVARVIALAASEGFELMITQGLRTFAEQDELFAQGRTKKGKVVTNARGGQSNHNYGLAVDVVFIKNNEPSWEAALYRRIGVWSAAVGLDWGGNWKSIKDLPHVELKDLPNYRVLMPIYKAGGIEAVWAKVENK